MRINKKWAVIVASLLLAAGLVISFGAWAAAGFDFRKLSSMDPEKVQTHEVSYDAAEVDTVEISIDVDDLDVRTSSDGQIHLRYTDRDRMNYALSQENGLLKLTQNEEGGVWFNFDFFSFYDDTNDTHVLLELPENFEGDLNFTCDVGDVELRKVSLQGALDVKVGTGSFDAEGLTARSVTAQSDVGDVEGDNWTVKQYVFMKSETGDVELYNSTMTDLSCYTDVGMVRLESVSAQKSELETETGDIKLEMLETDKLKASTDVGSITGFVKGEPSDYSILTSTDVGDSNLTDQIAQTGKELDVTTETGDINISFAK